VDAIHDHDLHDIDDAITDANAAIRGLTDLESGGRDGILSLICECTDDECLERVPLTALAYDSLHVRGEPVLAPGHMLLLPHHAASERPARRLSRTPDSRARSRSGSTGPTGSANPPGSNERTRLASI
jgi:hypothetical protein